MEPILDASWIYFGNLGLDLDALGTNLVTFLAWHCTAAGSSCCGCPQLFIFCASCEACLCFVCGVSAVCLGASSGAVPVHTVGSPRSLHQYSGHEARYTNGYQSGLDMYHEARYILSDVSLDVIRFFSEQRCKTGC